MGIKRKFCLLLIVIATCLGASAQKVGIKTNILPDALLSPNLGIEIGLKPHWSLDITGEGNFWTVDRHKWKHWLVQPEARYWLCERFAGHFFGLHGIGGEFNFGNIKNSLNVLGMDFSQLSDKRYQGWGVGAGIGYGYSWIINDHWNFEAEIGVGYIYTRYDVYPCANCGTKLESDKSHNYVGPTKAALNLVYVF